MDINQDLKKYISDNIFPEYSKNDLGHNLSHIKYVINRSLNFAKQAKNVDLNMVYTVASYHDIGHHINPKEHEIVSAKILEEDNNLRNFFTEEEILIMKEAVEDHRASSKKEPRSIYGKIVSSADRNTSVDVSLRRTYQYRLKYSPGVSLNYIVNESRQHLINKFGTYGYAREKMFFKDLDYEKYLNDITSLCQDKDAFLERFLEVNNLSLKVWDLFKFSAYLDKLYALQDNFIII